MADTKVTQAALDKAEGVKSTPQIAEDVKDTDDVIQAGNDYLFLKMGGMVPVSAATVAALKSGSVGGSVTPAAAVPDLAAGADAATIVTTVNKLLANLRSAGLLAK